MAADAFTQIRNAVFRDSRLSAKAMGIFGNISTHRDGWGITPEFIATQMRDGVNAIRSGLKELEAYGYLQRTQTRDPQTGRLGPSEYYITDQPEAVMEASGRGSGRSGPSDDFPHTDDPSTGRPHAADHLHKKTIPLEEDQLVENEISLPSVPAQRTARPAPAEREIVTPIDRPSTAQQVVRAANILTSSEDETAFVTWATARYRIRSGALWRTVAANGDLVDWVAAWRAEGCQAVAHGLTGTDAAVNGWYALADKPSVTDQRVQQALDLGRQMQAEANARHGSGHRPHNPNEAWTRMEQQAALGARPYGWEQVPHCGHLDCDEITRYREVDHGDGRSAVPCSGCHPSMRF